MNLLRKTAAALVLLLFATFSHAQTLHDIIQYSQYNPSSTARSLGLANAMGAVGGDLSTLSFNPAGLALYRSSEFSIGSSFSFHHNRDTYAGERAVAATQDFALNGTGGVFTFLAKPEKQSGLLALNFGVAYNRLKDYTYEYMTQGINSNHSFLDVLAQEANEYGLTPSAISAADAYSQPINWYIISAYDAYLIEPEWQIDAAGDTIYDADHRPMFSHFYVPLEPGQMMHQKQLLTSNGFLGEFAFSLGLNFSNKLYAGVTLGVQLLNHSWKKTHIEEADIPGNAYGFRLFRFQEVNTDNGAGINLKLGIIGRPIDNLRLGLAFHTPTVMAIDSRFSVAAHGEFTDDPMFTEGSSPEGKNTYSFSGPLRLMGSAAYFFGKLGFLSLDYHFVYVPIARFSNSSDFALDNELMVKSTRPIHQLQVGAEVLLWEMFALRAGGGFQSSPYSKDLWEPFGLRYFYTLGTGFSMGNFFLDLAFRHLRQHGETTLYAYGDIQPTVKRRSGHSILMATFGYRF